MTKFRFDATQKGHFKATVNLKVTKIIFNILFVVTEYNFGSLRRSDNMQYKKKVCE